MKTLLAIIFIIFSLPTNAFEIELPITSYHTKDREPIEQTIIHPHQRRVEHRVSNRQWNSNNYGLIIVTDISQTHKLKFGGYKNSVDNTTLLIGDSMYLTKYSRLNVGIATGYNNSILPMMSIELSLSHHSLNFIPYENGIVISYSLKIDLE